MEVITKNKEGITKEIFITSTTPHVNHVLRCSRDRNTTENESEEQKKKRKRKNKPKVPTYNAPDHVYIFHNATTTTTQKWTKKKEHSNVYVTGLPADITEEVARV